MIFFIALAFSLFTLTNSMAAEKNYGLYTSLNYGEAQDTGVGIKRIKGGVYGVQLGYRFYHWGLDVGYSTYDLESGHGKTADYRIVKGHFDAEALEATLRYTFWRFFTVGVGWNDVRTKENYYLTGVTINGNPNQNISYNDKGQYKGLLYNAGIVLPLFRWLDLRVIYENRNWLSEKYNGRSREKVNLRIQQLTGQLVYYFN